MKEKRRRITNEERICSYCGDIESFRYMRFNGSVYCNKHYCQLKQYGKIIELNRYIVYNTHVELLVTNRAGTTSVVKIDSDDMELVQKYKWNITSAGYVRASINNDNSTDENILLHRLLMGLDKFKNQVVVDHVDGNPLNNMRNNIRIATRSQNSMNTKISSDNTSGIKGVSFSKSRNKWEAYISINKKKINLGRFKEFSEAVQKRKEAEQLYFKEFRRVAND